MLNRRVFCGSLAALAATGPRAQAVERVELPLPSGRSLSLGLWPAAGTARAAVVFSHGLGSQPEAYALLFDALQRAGCLVAAPLHVDSMQHPQRERYTIQQGFGERMADLRTACGYLAARFSALPLAVAGHSYGSLLGWCLGGALAEVGPFRMPAVKAVLAFSSPGVLPMMDRNRSLASLAVPTLVVTGTRDTVPGYVQDWRDHRLVFEQSTQRRGALVVDGGGHELVVDPPTMDKVLPWALDFLEAEVLGQAAARERLAHAASTPGLSWQWRA